MIKMAAKKVSISLPEDTLEQIISYAKTKGISVVSEAVLDLIRLGLAYPAEARRYNLNDFFEYAGKEYRDADNARIEFTKHVEFGVESWQVVVTENGQELFSQKLGREEGSDTKLLWGSYK